MKVSELSRFIPKFVVGPTDCWNWIANVNNRGYGLFRMEQARRNTYAHRVAYEHWNGAISEGLELDHLCRNPRCVNPAHLEPVTHSENMRRSPLVGRQSRDNYRRRGTNGNEQLTHCCRGHAFTSENTYRNSKGSRVCRTCARAATLANYYKRRTLDVLQAEQKAT